MTVIHRSLLAAAAALACLPAVAAPADALRDAGPLDAAQRAQAITVTVAMPLRDADAAEALIQRQSTPGDALWRRFLSPDEFRARFAPDAAQRARVAARLRELGLSVEAGGTSTTLRASGSPAAFERAFGTTLHAWAGEQGRFHAPATPLVLPADIAPFVQSVLGLDDRPVLQPHHRFLPDAPAPATGPTGTRLGRLTVTDFAQHYDVEPLYARGVQGQGQTLAIVALAAMTPSDAFRYWDTLGLVTDPDRLSFVDVDGGPGAPKDKEGSIETTLDVQQSGGVAPAANIVVYQGKIDMQGYVDAFATAIDADVAGSISTSWGAWEWFGDKRNRPVTDPHDGHEEGTVRALHALFVQAALQGQTVIAASGDQGAYDADAVAPVPWFSHPLSVDYPAADPLVLAAGGTTLPYSRLYPVGHGQPPVRIDVPAERVWGYDYMEPYCEAMGRHTHYCKVQPGGTGGGVSVVFPRPFYQAGLEGFRESEPGQVFALEGQPIHALPANFAGRNVPDLSFDADPLSGYVVLYTSSAIGFMKKPNGGGTSFVSPEINGVAALLQQSTGGRLGLLNASLYRIARAGGYAGAQAPLRATPDGGNDFYRGSDGYNLATGLGFADVANLADALARMPGR